MSGKGGVVGYLGVSKTRKLYCILIAEVYLTNILPPVLVIFPLGLTLKYTNTLPLKDNRSYQHSTRLSRNLLLLGFVCGKLLPVRHRSPNPILVFDQ